MRTARRLILPSLLAALGAGCSSARPSASPVATGPEEPFQLQNPTTQSSVELVQLDVANKTLVEWQVARLAMACDRVARQAESRDARREAFRLKAAYASSSYSITTTSNPMVQLLDMTALAALSEQVWVVERRAETVFGGQSGQVEAAFKDIRRRTQEHARRYISDAEFHHVEQVAHAWRISHPNVVAAEFIRLEAFTDMLARSMVQDSRSEQLLDRIKEAATDVELTRLLLERAVYLAGRMPRLVQWHAEAAAADLLAQPELADALASLKQLGALERELPPRLEGLESLKHLEMLQRELAAQLKAIETRLASMPAEFTAAAAKLPEVARAGTELEQTSRRLEAVEQGVFAIESSVASLPGGLARLTAATQPESVQRIAASAGAVLARDLRPLMLLATGCVLVILVVQALLRRWSGRLRWHD